MITFTVKFVGFNLVSTAILFLSSLMLRRLSQTSTNIPAPRAIDAALAIVDRFIPIPRGGKDAEDTQAGQYSDIAHSLNNLIFALFFVIYVVVVVACFVF